MDEQPRADVSLEATGIQLSQTFCLWYTSAHFFAGVTRAGRPSSKYVTTPVSLHVLFCFFMLKARKKVPTLGELLTITAAHLRSRLTAALLKCSSTKNTGSVAAPRKGGGLLLWQLTPDLFGR